MNETSQTSLEKAIERHYQKNQLPEFQDYLFQKITSRLHYEQQMSRLRPRLWTAITLLAGSLMLLFFAANISYHAFVNSSISQFLSLIFTDFKQVADNWQDYSFSILENLPLGAMFLLLSAFVASLWLIDFSTSQIASFRKLTHLHSHH